MTSPPTPPSESSDSPPGSSPATSPGSQPVESRPSFEGPPSGKTNGNGARSLNDIVSPKTRNVVALVIASVWALTLLAPLVVQGFVPPANASFVMSVMAGAVFGSNFVQKK